MNKRDKFSSNVFTKNDDTFNAKTIPDEIEPSLNIDKDEISRFKDENILESVGVEYGDLVKQLGTAKKKKEIERIGSAIVNGEEEDEEKYSIINSNIDDLEEKIKNLRKQREEDAEKMLEKQRRINKKLNNIRENQKKSDKIKDNEYLEKEVNNGIEARLNVLTRKNLLLQEENQELNEIIVQKNSHIAKLMKEMRELKKENMRLEEVNRELGILAENGKNEVKGKNGGDGRLRNLNEQTQDFVRGAEPISKRVKFLAFFYFFLKDNLLLKKKNYIHI